MQCNTLEVFETQAAAKSLWEPLDCIRLLQWDNWSPALRVEPAHPPFLGAPKVAENRENRHALTGTFTVSSGDDRGQKTAAAGRRHPTHPEESAGLQMSHRGKGMQSCLHALFCCHSPLAASPARVNDSAALRCIAFVTILPWLHRHVPGDHPDQRQQRVVAAKVHARNVYKLAAHWAL